MQVEDCRVKLTRADKLIGGLGGERTRWQVGLRIPAAWSHARHAADLLLAWRLSFVFNDSLLHALTRCAHTTPLLDAWPQATVLKLQADLSNLVGDIALSAGAIAYSGPFVPAYRAALLAEWGAALERAGVAHSKGAGLVSTLADPVKVTAKRPRSDAACALRRVYLRTR